MKRFLSVVLVTIISAFCLVGCNSSAPLQQTPVPQKQKSGYQAIEKIDPCVVEPDDRAYMTDDDRKHYRALMEALLSRQESVTLSENQEKNEYYIDLLKQSPYYFFAESCTLIDDTAYFVYAYSQQEQTQMQTFIDNKFLEIVNKDIVSSDNELDVILKLHSAVAGIMTYDSEREDNKQLGSELFLYPADEIYKGLKDEKGLCYAFSYTLRFAMLQRGIDCFCIYGPCTDRNEAHMWNIFKYNGKYYNCDSTWDRKDEVLPKLYQFGKTDDERVSDFLEVYGFSSHFFEEYGTVECTDDMFRIFRSIGQYEWIGDHNYRMVDWDGNEYVFDSEKFTLTEK